MSNPFNVDAGLSICVCEFAYVCRHTYSFFQSMTYYGTRIGASMRVELIARRLKKAAEQVT